MSKPRRPQDWAAIVVLVLTFADSVVVHELTHVAQAVGTGASVASFDLGPWACNEDGSWVAFACVYIIPQDMGDLSWWVRFPQFELVAYGVQFLFLAAGALWMWSIPGRPIKPRDTFSGTR